MRSVKVLREIWKVSSIPLRFNQKNYEALREILVILLVSISTRLEITKQL